MSKCSKCDADFSPVEVVAKCVDCKRTFHPTCTRAGSVPNFTKSKNKLKCDGCAEESGSNVSVRSNEDSVSEDKKFFLEALRSFKNDINQNTDEKINKVLESVSTLAEDIKVLQKSVSGLEVSHKQLEERCVVLEHDNSQLRGELSRLQLQLQDSEQHQRSANIEIVGLPSTEGEDIYTCLSHVARAIGVDYKRDGISIAHRLRLFSKKKHSQPPIIVQFVSRSDKLAWLAAARKKSTFNSTEINASLPPNRIYVNDHLTGYNKTLLGTARRLVREKRIHFAGFFNGKVLVKATATSDSIRVSTLDDLNKFG